MTDTAQERADDHQIEGWLDDAVARELRNLARHYPSSSFNRRLIEEGSKRLRQYETGDHDSLRVKIRSELDVPAGEELEAFVGLLDDYDRLRARQREDRDGEPCPNPRCDSWGCENPRHLVGRVMARATKHEEKAARETSDTHSRRYHAARAEAYTEVASFLRDATPQREGERGWSCPHCMLVTNPHHLSYCAQCGERRPQRKSGAVKRPLDGLLIHLLSVEHADGGVAGVRLRLEWGDPEAPGPYRTEEVRVGAGMAGETFVDTEPPAERERDEAITLECSECEAAVEVPIEGDLLRIGTHATGWTITRDGEFFCPSHPTSATPDTEEDET